MAPITATATATATATTLDKQESKAFLAPFGWQSIAPMNHGRGYAACAVFEGRIYIFGGKQNLGVAEALFVVLFLFFLLVCFGL